MTTFAKDVASVIRGMLAEQNTSQTALAERLGRAQSYVSERETAKRYWTTADLDVIAEVLGRTPANLLHEVLRRIRAAELDAPSVSLSDDGVATRPSAPQPDPAPRKPPARSRQD